MTISVDAIVLLFRVSQNLQSVYETWLCSESDLLGNPLEKKARRFPQSSSWGHYIDLISALLSILTLLTYIIETYFVRECF